MKNIPLQNPYEDAPEEPTFDFGTGLARFFAVFFLLSISVPGVLAVFQIAREDASVQTSDTLEGRLREWESRFEDAELFEKWRGKDQARLVRWFSEGNSRVVIGSEGWLFYKPDIDAAVGKGPRYVEPPSVAREPSGRIWRSPLPIVREFALQLRERDISLILVPVPTKAMIERRGLNRNGSDADEFRMPPEWNSVKEEIESYGVNFVDLVPLFQKQAGEGNVFLRQDTHWTPETMEEVAGILSSQVKAVSSVTWERRRSGIIRESRGDLVDMLQVDEKPDHPFPLERVELTRILDASLNLPLASDSDSPVVLLGDSFVNIFEDPSLGFGAEKEEKIGAGLSSHLADRLGYPLQTIAINGGGATDVRKAFASLPEDQVRKKKAVFWVFSARDLFLAEVPARRAGIEWEPVEFSTLQQKVDVENAELVITGTLSKRSQAGDPGKTPYSSALYSGIFTDLEVESGEYSAGEVFVFLWAFQERKYLPSAHLKIGKRYRLKLVPLPESGPEASATQIDDFFRVDLERLFAREFELLE